MNTEQIASIIRAIFKFGAGFLIAKGWGDATLWEAVAGGAVALSTIVWAHQAHNPVSMIK